MDIVVLAVLCSVLGSVAVICIYKIIRIAIRYTNSNYSSVQHESKKPASAISGNFVQEYEENVPITKNYRLTRLFLGRGSSAEVYVGESRTNYHRYAIKIIDLSKKDVRWKYERERDLLKDIEQSNIIRLFEVYHTPKQMFFVMELCTGGHLGHFLKRQPNQLLPELKARNFILQITRALMHCHEHGICHRDIKLQNILLENNSSDAQVKIVDFGNAVRFVGCTPLKKVVGTTYTAAPEVFRQHYDERCDVWSLGVVAYILLSGRRPFERLELDQTPVVPSMNVQQVLPKSYRKNAEGTVIASILLGRYHFHHEAFQTVSHEAIYFIKACMEQDYEQRPHAIQLLSHPWLRNDFLLHQSLQSPSSSPTAAQRGKDSESPSQRGEEEERGGGGGGRKTILNRRLFSFPVISPSGVKTLVDSSQRYLNNPNQTGMRDTSMLAIAFTMPVNKIKQIRNLFQEIDRNGNGLLEKDEFRVAMLQVQSELSSVDIDVLFDCMDQNGDGNISFLEFVAAMIDPRTIDIRQMNQAFKLLDQDHKGYLTKEDFLRVLYTADTILLTEEECWDLKQLSNTELQTMNPQQYFQERIQQRYIPPSMTTVTTTNQTKAGSIHSPSNPIMGRMTMIEFEKEWIKEFQRQKQLRERVEQLFRMADVNGDGQLSYSEFLFAMAEGSLQLTDFISPNRIPTSTVETTNPAAPTIPPSLTGISQKPPSALFPISTMSTGVPRRQTEGNVKRLGYRFKLRTPTFRRPTHHLTSPNKTSSNPQKPISSFWSVLSWFSWQSTSPSKVKPEAINTLPPRLEDLYVRDPKELRGEQLDPVEYLDDSPLVTRREGRRVVGGSGDDESSSNTSTTMNPTAISPTVPSMRSKIAAMKAKTANQTGFSSSNSRWMSLSHHPSFPEEEEGGPKIIADIENQLEREKKKSAVASQFLKDGLDSTPVAIQRVSDIKPEKKKKKSKQKQKASFDKPPPMLTSKHRAITSPALLCHNTSSIPTSTSGKSGKKPFSSGYSLDRGMTGGSASFVASSSSDSEEEGIKHYQTYQDKKTEEEQQYATAPFESPVMRSKPSLSNVNDLPLDETEAKISDDSTKERVFNTSREDSRDSHQKDLLHDSNDEKEEETSSSHFLSNMKIEPEDSDEEGEQNPPSPHHTTSLSAAENVLPLSGRELDDYLASQATLPPETEMFC